MQISARHDAGVVLMNFGCRSWVSFVRVIRALIRKSASGQQVRPMAALHP
jgi:hypothetical protein